jgi:hypothetical protein
MDMDKLPLAYLKAIVDANWAHLLHATQYAHETDALVDRCIAAEERAEREHRRGKYSRTGYIGSATTAARAFVLRHVWSADPTKTIADTAGFSERVTRAYALSALMRQHRTPKDNRPGPTMWAVFAERVTTLRLNSVPGVPVTGLVGMLADYHPDAWKLVTSGHFDAELPAQPLFMAIDYSRDFTR